MSRRTTSRYLTEQAETALNVAREKFFDSHRTESLLDLVAAWDAAIVDESDEIREARARFNGDKR